MSLIETYENRTATATETSYQTAEDVFNHLSAGVFSKVVFILPRFIITSHDDISRSRPIWTLNLS